MNHNKITLKNPLNDYMNDDRIRKYAGNMIKPYQTSFVYYKHQIPDTQNNCYISHICGMAEEPMTYENNWSSCITPQHMISEPKPSNLSRKTCHRFIRLFKSKIIVQNRRTNNNKGITITVGNVQSIVAKSERIKIIERKGIRGSNKDINNLLDHKCRCNKECFINYGGRQRIKLFYNTAINKIQFQ